MVLASHALECLVHAPFASGERFAIARDLVSEPEHLTEDRIERIERLNDRRVERFLGAEKPCENASRLVRNPSLQRSRRPRPGDTPPFVETLEDFAESVVPGKRLG
jgi:hypothetical protein